VSFTLDANLLLYASDGSSPFHERARGLVRSIAEGPELVYLFWPVAMAYLRIATHPSIFDEPLTPADAAANLGSLIQRPHVRTPGESGRFWRVFQDVTSRGPIRGNDVPDAHLVGLMREHGVRTIWTNDRGFRRFDSIEVRDPFD
jgi:hypothetical protein